MSVIPTTDDPAKVHGQWIGTYTGTSEGTIILNIDECDAAYEGVAYLLPTAGALFPGLDGTCEELRDRNFEI